MHKLLPILILLSCATSAHAALSVVQAANGLNASGTAVTVTVTTTAGNLLVIFTAEGANATSTVTISDSNGGNTWTQTSSGYSPNGTANRGAIFYCANCSSVTSVTATWSGSLTDIIGGVVYEVSGAATASPQDASVNNSNATGTTATSGSLTTTNANDILLFGARMRTNETTYTAGTGYTFPTGSSTTREGMEYKIVSATQSGVTATFTFNASTTNLNIFAAFKAAAAGAACTPTLPLMGVGRCG